MGMRMRYLLTMAVVVGVAAMGMGTALAQHKGTYHKAPVKQDVGQAPSPQVQAPSPQRHEDNPQGQGNAYHKGRHETRGGYRGEGTRAPAKNPSGWSEGKKTGWHGGTTPPKSSGSHKGKKHRTSHHHHHHR